MNDAKLSPEEISLLDAVQGAVRAADPATVAGSAAARNRLYLEIGGILAEADAAPETMARLAEPLAATFPKMGDFSAEDLAAMKEMHAAYSGHPVLASLVDAVTWEQHRLILGACADDRAREFYIRMTRKFDWSVDVLEEKLETFRPAGSPA